MPIVSYLAPIYVPAIGGCVVYVSILARELTSRDACDKFRVITERHPDAPGSETSADGRVEIHRTFPFRAGRSTRGIASYLAYAVQNIQFLNLSRLLDGTDVLFVHGSFFNNPALLSPGLRLIRKDHPGLRLVLDLRDPKFPDSLVRKAAFFDATVSCSRNISNRLIDVPNVWDIPVMIEDRTFGDSEKSDVLKKYGLPARGFVFNGSGFNQGKGSDALIRLVQAMRSQGRDVSLVVAGKRRFWNSELEEAQREGWLVPLGIIPSLDVRALAASSWLDANLSTVDSFPRHSLEALASGARVLLPRGVPEFVDACPQHVAEPPDDVEALANRAIAIAEGAIEPCCYPWHKHLPGEVIAQYEDLIGSLVKH